MELCDTRRVIINRFVRARQTNRFSLSCESRQSQISGTEKLSEITKTFRKTNIREIEFNNYFTVNSRKSKKIVRTSRRRVFLGRRAK